MPQSGVARAGSPAVASPRPLFLTQMHQSIHDVFVRLETRGGHVYNRREEDVEQERREHAPLAKALFLYLTFLTAGVRDRPVSGSGVYMEFMGAIIRAKGRKLLLFHWVVVHL